MRVIIEQIDKLLLNKAELKKEYSTGTQYIRPEKEMIMRFFLLSGLVPTKSPTEQRFLTTNTGNAALS